ncbi:unnamed protein product [Meganyctiphanes norvegica]|uniref:MYND-type domain-containing protein n=1 Tax=Meganyctiphanes norvegica TaxID=48144 RepID=A0AAV2RT23_MEGNR
MATNGQASEDKMLETKPKRDINKEMPGFFKDYAKMVRMAITNDKFNEFTKCTTDEERIRFIFAIPEVHDISLKTYFRPKSEKEAVDYKEQGNKAFGKNENAAALRFYSQAVLKAPVPTGKYWKLIKENADPKKMTLYSICLANRSAALYHLREHQWCVKDIDEALEHHYPKELKWKLYNRKAHIMLSFRRHIDAQEAFRQALKWLDWSKMERERRMEHQKKIQKWLQLFKSGKVENYEEVKEVELLPLVPYWSHGPSENFPALSKKVEVLHDNNQGRYAVAAEDINPGDVLAVEDPYAYVLMRDDYLLHCQNCFASVKAAIPCKSCAAVVYCSVECREKSYFHSIECNILDLLFGSGMSINCFLAFRMVTQSPLSFFLEQKDKLREMDPKETLAVTKESPYVGTDFMRIYNLVRHENQRTQEDNLHRTIMAAFLLKSLRKTKYFGDKGSGFAAYPLIQDQGDDRLNDIEAFMGGIILRFTGLVQFNAHEVSEYCLQKPKTIDDSHNETIGAALYPSLALFNHSCHGAQVRYFSGNKVITKAYRKLKKGEMIPENYGQTYVAAPKSKRKQELKERYWFDCLCQACQDDWPMYKDFDPKMLKFKCQKCQEPRLIDTDRMMMPFFKCDGCGDQTNILGALKNLQNTEQTYKAAMTEMNGFNIRACQKLLIENMNQLDTALAPPYRDYHMTQEAFMKCCLAEGNTIIRPGKPKEERMS